MLSINALYLTPYRYLVFGTWVHANHNTSTPKSVARSSNGYHVNIPATLQKKELTSMAHSLLMGKLTFTGKPERSYTESNSPLSALKGTVQLYSAWVEASVHQNRTALKSLVPEAKWAQNPLLRVRLSTVKYNSPFNVVLDVKGNKLIGATATTGFLIQNVAYKIKMFAKADSQFIHIEKISVTS